MNERHGCYNRKPFSDHYIAGDGLKIVDAQDGTIAFGKKIVRIKHTMSRDCRHPERATDQRCADCKWITMTDEEVRAQLASK